MIALQEAVDYIKYGIGEGRYEPDQFEGWTEKEIVEFAKSEMAKGDHYANSQN